MQILFREHLAPADERHVLAGQPNVTSYRSQVKPGVVVGRYATLPHYEELQVDLVMAEACLANSVAAHQWIAKLKWYETFRDHTPETWNEHELPHLDGPFVIKGETNSKKWQWRTHMFAETRSDAARVIADLRQDSMIGDQAIKIRRYVPLKVHEPAVIGPPFAHEYRFFFWKTVLLASGYYWATAETYPDVPLEAEEFARSLASTAANHATFFVLDVALTEAGKWILVEINDGQQSGLCTINPQQLYDRLGGMDASPALDFDRLAAQFEKEDISVKRDREWLRLNAFDAVVSENMRTLTWMLRPHNAHPLCRKLGQRKLAEIIASSAYPKIDHDPRRLVLHSTP